MATITSLGFNIYAKWDGSGMKDAQAQLDHLKEKLDSIQDSITIQVHFDDAQATASLDELKAKLNNLDANIKVRLDDAPVKSELDDLTRARDMSVQASVDKATEATAAQSLNDLARDRTAAVDPSLNQTDADRVAASLMEVSKDRKAEILADLGASSVDEAMARLDEMAHARNASIYADLDAASEGATKAELDALVAARKAAIMADPDVASVGKTQTMLDELTKLRTASIQANLLGDAQVTTEIDALTRDREVKFQASFNDLSMEQKIAILSQPHSVEFLADAQVAQAKTALDTLASAKRTADITANANIADAKAKLDDLAKLRQAQVNANLVGDDVAKLRLDALIKQRTAEIKASLNDMGVGARLDFLARTRDVKFLVDDSDKSKLDSFKASLDGITASASSAVGKVSGIQQAIALLGPVVVGLGAQILGLSGAIVSGFGSATLAVLPFAASVFGTVKSATALNQTLDPLNTKLDQQTAALAKLTPGSKQYASAQQAIAQTQSQINAAMAAATPVQRQVAASMKDMSTAWQNFQAQAEKLTGPILAGAFQLAAKVLPQLLPLVAAVAPLFQNLLNIMNRFNTSGGFSAMVQWLVAVGVPNLKNVMDTVGHLFVTLWQIIVGFQGPGLGFTAWLAKVTGELDKWGAGGGFFRFSDRITQDWPRVKQVLTDVGTAVLNLIQAFGGLSAASFTGIGMLMTFLQFIGSYNVGTLQAIIVGFMAVKAAILISSAISGTITFFTAMAKVMETARGVILGLRFALVTLIPEEGLAAVATGIWAGALDALALAAAAAGVSMGVLVGIIALAVVALVAVGFGIYELVTHWSAAWNGIKTAAATVWGWLQTAFKTLMSVFMDYTPLGLLVTHWSQIWNAIKTAASVVWDALKTAWSVFINALATVWTTVSGALKTAWSAVWNALKTAGQAIWDGIKAAWNAVCTAFTTVWTTVSNALKTAWSAVWNALKTAGQAIWDSIKAAWNAVCTAFTTVWTTVSSALKTAWNDVWNWIKSTASAIWQWLQTGWHAAIQFLVNDWNTVSGVLKTAWNDVWNWIKSTANAIWQWIQTGWHAAIQFLVNDWNTVSGVLKTAWNDVWNWIKSTANAIWQWIQTGWHAAIQFLINDWNTVSGVFKTAWNDVWNWVKTTAENVWNDLKGAWTTFSGWLKTGVTDLVSGIKAAWNLIEGAFKGPINFVIQTIWDDGLLKLWGMAHNAISAIPAPPAPMKQLAEGGHVTGPGTSTSDSIPAMLSHGEFVLNAKAVEHYGMGTIASMNARKLAGGGPVLHLASGGGISADGSFIDSQVSAGANWQGMNNTTRAQIIAIHNSPARMATLTPNEVNEINGFWTQKLNGGGNIISTIGGAVKSAIGAATKFVAGLAAKAWEATAGPLLSGMKSKVNSMDGNSALITGGVTAVPQLVYDAVDKLLKAADTAANTTGGGGQGVIPSGQHLAIIDQALKAAGVPPPGTLGQWEAGLNTLITRESGWNSSAINKTDSNAAAGIPSQGLAQVIPPTFQQYHVAGTSSAIMDPVANVAAAIRYIVARYGNITNVQQANASLPPKGYDSGGWMMPGFGTHFNGTGKPEAVLTSDQWANVEALASGSGGSGGGDMGDVHININGAQDPQAVAAAVQRELNNLRMLMQQGTGRRSH